MMNFSDINVIIFGIDGVRNIDVENTLVMVNVILDWC